jgi:hypothetical protein
MPTDIVSFCVFVGQAKPSKGVLDELCAATDVVQEASRAGSTHEEAPTTHGETPLCADAGTQGHIRCFTVDQA